MTRLIVVACAACFGACIAVECAQAQQPIITPPPPPPVFNPSYPYTVPQPPYTPISPTRPSFSAGSVSIPVARPHRRAVGSSSKAAKVRAGAVPVLRVEPLCRATSTQSVNPFAAGDAKAAFDQCVQAERSYREQVEKEWSNFSQADRQHCTSLVQMGGSASYAELITCLEMARDVRQSKGSSTDLQRNQER